MNKAAAVLFSGLLLSACTTAQMNKPLTPQSLRSDGEFISTGGYRFGTLHDGRSAQELLVLLSISGGGKRSAAFGYGVLKGLRNFVISINGQERRLLDEIDMMIAVSGGSFPAA